LIDGYSYPTREVRENVIPDFENVVKAAIFQLEHSICSHLDALRVLELPVARALRSL
jgi:hypothetical protein